MQLRTRFAAAAATLAIVPRTGAEEAVGDVPKRLAAAAFGRADLAVRGSLQRHGAVPDPSPATVAVLDDLLSVRRSR